MGSSSYFRYIILFISGTVTSVALTVPSILTVTGSPITSSGTLAISTTTTPTGTGAIVLANTPTLVTPVLGAATGTSLSLSGTLICSTGTFNGTPQGAAFINSSKLLSSRPGFSYQLYFATANTAIPNNTWTVIDDVYLVQGGGSGALTFYNPDVASFRNDQGTNVLYMCTFTSKPLGTVGTWAMRIDCGGTTISSTELAAGKNEICISATGVIGSLQELQFLCNQYSGAGQFADGIRISITTYPIL